MMIESLVVGLILSNIIFYIWIMFLTRDVCKLKGESHEQKP